MSNLIDFQNYMNQLDQADSRSIVNSDSNLDTDILEFTPREQKSFDEVREELIQAVIEDSPALMSNFAHQIMDVCKNFAKDFANEYNVPQEILQDIFLDEGLNSVLDTVNSKLKERHDMLAEIYNDFQHHRYDD